MILPISLRTGIASEGSSERLAQLEWLTPCPLLIRGAGESKGVTLEANKRQLATLRGLLLKPENKLCADCQVRCVPLGSSLPPHRVCCVLPRHAPIHKRKSWPLLTALVPFLPPLTGLCCCLTPLLGLHQPRHLHLHEVRRCPPRSRSARLQGAPASTEVSGPPGCANRLPPSLTSMICPSPSQCWTVV